MPAYAMQAEMIRWACSLGVDFTISAGCTPSARKTAYTALKEGFCHSVGVTELAGEFDQVLSPFWYFASARQAPAKAAGRHKK